MSQMTPSEVSHLYRRFAEFSNLSSKNRLMFFDTVSPKICSDEWREKFRRFLQKENTSEYNKIVDEVFIHTQLYESDSDKITACHTCREAFWKLVFLSTIG